MSGEVARLAPRKDVVGLDLIRAFAALGVLLVHVYQLFLLHGQNLPWLRSGDVGVPIFFVLSGYLIATSVLRPARFDTREYGLRRAARILPLYYVALLIALVIVDPTPLLTQTGRWDVLAHVFMLHGLFGSTRYSINGVLWTLTVEVMFYALMAAIAPLFRKPVAGWVIAGAMVVIGVVYRALAWTDDFGATAYRVQQLPGAADQFGVGMALALALQSERVREVLRRGAVQAAVAAFTVVWLLPTLFQYHRRHTRYWFLHTFLTWWPLALAIGVAGLIVCMLEANALLDRKPIRMTFGYLGRVSFGIYLFNAFAIEALGRAWFAQGPDVPVGPFVALSIIGTVAVSAVLHHAVELPAMAKARLRRSSTPPSATPLDAAVPVLAVAADPVPAAEA